jgi:hypothetical protein
MKPGLAIVTALLVAGCTSTAQTYPINPAAFATGVVSIQFVRNLSDSGSLTATLPDGSVLNGHYAVTDGESFALLAGRFGTASVASFSGGRPVEADATNGRATLQCALKVNLGGNGGGACELEPSGALYRVTF